MNCHVINWISSRYTLLLDLLHFLSVHHVCLLARVLWRRKCHSSLKNTSLSTLLSGGFSRAYADLTMSFGHFRTGFSRGMDKTLPSILEENGDAELIWLWEVKQKATDKVITSSPEGNNRSPESNGYWKKIYRSFDHPQAELAPERGVENRGQSPRFSTSPEGPCEC